MTSVHPRRPALRPSIGNRLNCSDIWFHSSSSNSVSPRLKNDGPAGRAPRPPRGPSAARELQSPLAFGGQTDRTPGGSRGGPAGRKVSPAPINTLSLRQTAECQGSRKICGRQQEGWVAAGQAEGPGNKGPQGLDCRRPRSQGSRRAWGQRRNLLLREKLPEGENQPSLVK